MYIKKYISKIEIDVFLILDIHIEIVVYLILYILISRINFSSL